MFAPTKTEKLSGTSAEVWALSWMCTLLKIAFIHCLFCDIFEIVFSVSRYFWYNNYVTHFIHSFHYHTLAYMHIYSCISLTYSEWLCVLTEWLRLAHPHAHIARVSRNVSRLVRTKQATCGEQKALNLLPKPNSSPIVSLLWICNWSKISCFGAKAKPFVYFWGV